MEDKREIVRSYVGKGLRLSDCLQTAAMSKSSYYYRRNYRTGGRLKTTSTKRHGEPISNDLVVSEAKALLSKPFIDYGYRKVATYLKRAGYEIGKKKVYRLMSEHNLIQSPKIRSKSFDKEIIKQKPKATKPLQIIEIDIKYVYIDEENRNAYLITIFDVFHRQAYNWTLNYNMKAKRLIELILEFIDEQIIGTAIDPSKLEISFRTDNGSQFVSKVYRKLLAQFHFKNVYIPPATPQLNGHIESFHSTVQRLVCDSYEFKNLEHAREIFTQFYDTYNNERYLSCLLDYPPTEFIKYWRQSIIAQKEDKNKLIFFFKEEGKEARQDVLDTLPPSFEVNLKKNQDFVCSQNKDIVNLPKQIYAIEK